LNNRHHKGETMAPQIANEEKQKIRKSEIKSSMTFV